MPLILFIMLIICTTNSAVACDTNKTEDFDKFFSHFAEDKRFAIERTQYPLEKYGIEYKGIGKKNGSEFVEFHVSKSEDSVLPTISKLKKDNLMQYGKKYIFLPNATVDLSNPDDSYLLYYRFKLQGNCWYLVYTEYSKATPSLKRDTR